MSPIRHGWRVPTSLTLIVSLLLPAPAFALRKAQTDEQREAKGGLEETLRTPASPASRPELQRLTGLEEGWRPLPPEPARALEALRTAFWIHSGAQDRYVVGIDPERGEIVLDERQDFG